MQRPEAPSLELFLHHAASPFVRKVLLVCEELAIAPAEQVIDLTDADAMAAYRQVNPNGKFPALREREFVVWESNAILLYLATLRPDHKLDGREPREAARVHQWLFWELAHFATAVAPLVNHRLGFLPAPTRPEAELADEVQRLCRILDSQLAIDPYVAGQTPTLADFALAAQLTFADEAKLPIGDHESLAAWFQRMRERPSWLATEARKRAALEAFGVQL